MSMYRSHSLHSAVFNSLHSTSGWGHCAWHAGGRTWRHRRNTVVCGQLSLPSVSNIQLNIHYPLDYSNWTQQDSALVPSSHSGGVRWPTESPPSWFPGRSRLEAYLAPGHGVAQLGFVVDEGHEPHVGLDEEGPLQHQHGVRLPWQRAFLLSFLDSLD